MGHRTCKRVPLDFDAPLKEVWSGYQMPDDICPPDCTACGGTGYSPTARWLQRTFYDHNVVDGLGWGKHLLQADVDALVEAGRLRHLVRREPTEDNLRAHEWVTVPRTAAEVNEAQRSGGLLHECSLDSISAHIVTQARCERLGAPTECEACDGHGNIATPEEREIYENWTGTEPPIGDGWQLWETTSEGSPISPVFATAELLAEWAEEHATTFADMRATRAEWLRSFLGNSTDVDTLLVAAGGQLGTPMQGVGRG